MTSLAGHSTIDMSRGDPTAHIAALFDEHCAFVCRVLRHFGVDDAALEDAVQDVFVTAYRRWSSFEGRSSARSWLFGIARRIAYRYRRSADARARRFVAADDHDEGTDEPFARVQAAQSLAALLARIDRRKRSVFVLHELEGMTAPEIADALGIPVGTVHSRLRAAWQALGREAERERRRLRRELAGLRPPAPSPERRRRMWGMIGTGLAPLRSAPVATATGWLAQLKWVAVGWALGAGLLGARAAVLASSDRGVAPPSATAEREPGPPSARQQSVAPPSATRAAEAPSIVPTTAPPSPATAPSIDDPSAREPDARPKRTRSPTASDDGSLTAELALLGRAQAAIRDQDGTAALALLDEHARRFPRGQLLQERRTARVRALCAAGRRDEAAREAEAQGRDPASACP